MGSSAEVGKEVGNNVDGESVKQSSQAQGSRTRAAIALAIAVIAVLGVIVATKFVQDDKAATPVMLSNPELPDNDSKECSDLIGRLPSRVDGLVRAELADPAPAGAAVWRDINDDRVTLRCGVSLPDQYNELAKTEKVKDVEWLKVTDGDDSGLVTWFSVGKTPTIAVTSDESHHGALADLAEAIGADTDPANAPKRLPLALGNVETPEHDSLCQGLEAALPKSLGDRERVARENLPASTSENLIVWATESGDAITLLCGVSDPVSYANTTDQLTQVGDIVWFKEPTLSSGSNGTWYALGRERLVAVNLPMSAGASVLPEISDAIASNLKNISPSEEN